MTQHGYETGRLNLPFVGICAARLGGPDVLGKVDCQSHMPQPGGGTAHRGAWALGARFLARLIAARLSGRWRQTPFFDPDSGRPVAELVMPDKAARAALYPGRG